MEREHAGGRQILAEPQARDERVEYHGATYVYEVGLGRAPYTGPDAGEGRGLKGAGDRTNVDILPKLPPDPLAMRESSHRDDVHRTRGLAEAIGGLEEVTRILRDGLLAAP